MFEVKQSIDRKDAPGSSIEETDLGSFEALDEAISAARVARDLVMASGTDDYAWWTVKEPGAQLARWISDSRNLTEYVLDLRTGQLVEVGAA